MVAARAISWFRQEPSQLVVSPTATSLASFVRVPQSAESMVKSANGVSNKLLTMDHAT